MKKPFVDAHHHLWNLDKLDYGWLKRIGEMKPFGDPTPIQRNYELPELRDSDGAGLQLHKSVHLQCDPSIPDPVTETAYVHQQAADQGHDIRIVGFADLSKSNVEETLQRHMAFDTFRGIRQIVGRTTTRPELCFVQTNLMEDATWQTNYASLEKHNLSFDLQLYPEQMDVAAKLIAKHPNIPVAVNHAGCPFDLSDDGLTYWTEQLAKLADLDHVSIKFSGLGMYDANWTAQSAQRLFDTVLNLFGTQRLMFGSNYPVDKLMRPYKEIWQDYASWISPLSDSEQDSILCKNAEGFYRF